MNNKSVILPILAIGIVGTIAAVAGAHYVSAQNSQDGQTIVQRIAQRFGLKENDVQGVFDEHKADHRAEMKTKLDEKLTQSVKDGKLTEAQKQSIIAKMEELKSQRDAEREKFKTMTPQERKQAMETTGQDLETWAKAQGIDSSLLPFFGHFRGHKGMHHDETEKI